MQGSGRRTSDLTPGHPAEAPPGAHPHRRHGCAASRGSHQAGEPDERSEVELELHEHLDAAIVTLRGEHDLTTRTRVSEALSHASQQSNVLVDLSECTFADSSLINSLLIANMQLQQRGGRIEVVIPPDASAVQRITAITGLAQVVPSTPGATAPGETPKRSRLESGGQVP